MSGLLNLAATMLGTTPTRSSAVTDRAQRQEVSADAARAVDAYVNDLEASLGGPVARPAAGTPATSPASGSPPLPPTPLDVGSPIGSASPLPMQVLQLPAAASPPAGAAPPRLPAAATPAADAPQAAASSLQSSVFSLLGGGQAAQSQPPAPARPRPSLPPLSKEYDLPRSRVAEIELSRIAGHAAAAAAPLGEDRRIELDALVDDAAAAELELAAATDAEHAGGNGYDHGLSMRNPTSEMISAYQVEILRVRLRFNHVSRLVDMFALLTHQRPTSLYTCPRALLTTLYEMDVHLRGEYKREEPPAKRGLLASDFFSSAPVALAPAAASSTWLPATPLEFIEAYCPVVWSALERVYDTRLLPLCDRRVPARADVVASDVGYKAWVILAANSCRSNDVGQRGLSRTKYEINKMSLQSRGDAQEVAMLVYRAGWRSLAREPTISEWMRLLGGR